MDSEKDENFAAQHTQAISVKLSDPASCQASSQCAVQSAIRRGVADEGDGSQTFHLLPIHRTNWRWHETDGSLIKLQQLWEFLLVFVLPHYKFNSDKTSIALQLKNN